MRFKKRLGAMLAKLALLVILLIMLQGAASAPMSKITNCQFEQRYFHVCSTGTGAHAVTKEDVIRFLNSQPEIGHDSGLVHVLAISELKYTTLGNTDYFQGMSGSDLPAKSTPVVLVKLRGIVANSDTRPVTGRHQFYEDASLVLIINAQTGDIFSALQEPA
ncbi:MAG: hypothetical protein H0W02_19175 [Ktedonobacteraceae bacterium]|nr:hypothetical protein [Ktedonobacteraceae bacterium]